MEEDWDIIDSTSSSLSTSIQQQQKGLELNFNRFSNQPAYEINEDECQDEDYDQQLMDEGVIFSDESSIKEIDFTLGDSKLMNNDTTEPIDDVPDTNNELEQQRIDQLKNNYLSHIFPLSIMDPQDNSLTRETDLDRTSVWRNSETGTSVPYISDTGTSAPSISDTVPENFEHPPYGGNFGSFSLFSSPTQTSLNPSANTIRRFGQLEAVLDNPPEQLRQLQLQRPIIPVRRGRKTKPTLNTESMPAYASTPVIPTLEIEYPQNNTNIPPEPPAPPAPQQQPVLQQTVSEQPVTQQPMPQQVIPQQPVPQQPVSQQEQHEIDPDTIFENVTRCFEFSIENEQLANICEKIETLMPNITQWYSLRHLDISRQNITALNHLARSFPMLETLNVSHNELKVLSDLPNTLCYLYASHNRLFELDIYHLGQLQSVDISNNLIHEFEDMSALKSLRALDASNNNMESCSRFQTLPALMALSLKNNNIRRLTGFSDLVRHQLESLDISFNRIEILDSVDSLRHLCELNLINNNIRLIRLDRPMERLGSLKLSYNRLNQIDISFFPNARLLFLDDNQIQRVDGASLVSKIVSFSLRDQGSEKSGLNLQYLRCTRKLYLSGSAFKQMHQLFDFYALEYLELCSAELKELPADFSKRVPNLNNLYLSMNQLEDIRPLKKLRYLRRLILIDNKLLSLNEVVAVVKHMTRLNVLDLRQNPMSANIYAQLNMSTDELISPYIFTAHDAEWPAQDLQFCADLTGHWRTRRDLYRALFIKECPKLKELDHLPVSLHDRCNADTVIGNYHQACVPNTN